MGPCRRAHVAHPTPQVGPVRQRKPREQATLADPEEGDLTVGHPELATQAVDQVLDRDLDVRGRELGEVHVTNWVAVALEAALADEIGLFPVAPVPVTNMIGVRVAFVGSSGHLNAARRSARGTVNRGPVAVASEGRRTNVAIAAATTSAASAQERPRSCEMGALNELHLPCQAGR